MKRTGAQIIVGLLEREGVRTVAGIPGGANLPLYDALGESRIRHVLARHEQGAGFMAQGMARVTGRAGVCFGTSGPGATNLVSAIADAKLDSIPLVAITGQVPRALIGTDAFQEVDTCGMTRPISKRVFFAESGADLLEIVPKAFALAESGRPGPVVVDVPKDVQNEVVEFDDWPAAAPRELRPRVRFESIQELAARLDAAERPVLLVGGGVIASGASVEVTKLARATGAFVAMTLNGLGAFPAGDPLSLGMLGMHGAPSTNWVLDEADLLVALGARFDDRATGKVSEFCPNATIAHVDIDPREIGKNKPADIGIVGDVGFVTRTLLEHVRHQRRDAWRQRVQSLQSAHPMPACRVSEGRSPLRVLEAMASALPANAIVTTDVGQHQMWLAQWYPVSMPRTLLTSGGLGTMGFGLPAAIGAALAKPEAKVVCVSGDGSFLMNIQELATLRELDLDVTVLVWNNQHLGLVRQQQELFYGGRYQASRFDSDPDFVGIARGFGLLGVNLEHSSRPLDTLASLLQRRGPLVVNVPIAQVENVLPMVAPGASNREMLGTSAQPARVVAPPLTARDLSVESFSD